MKTLRRWTTFLMVLFLPCLARAEYPDRPIKLVVPFAPGGNIDATARIVAGPLGEKLGQPIVIDNRAGAGGVIGAEIVAQAPPDGYTLLLASSGALGTSKALRPEMKLDPARDLISAGSIARAPLVLVVGASVPVKTFAEYVAYAKEREGKVTVASSGVGTAAHLTAELLQMQSGIRLIHVPYRGSGPAVTDLLGGQVDSMFDQLASTLPQIQAGKLRALAVTTARRSALVPGVPTLVESGVPGFESSTTAGMMAPAGTPKPVMDRLNLALRQVLGSDDVKARFAELGSEVVPGSGAEFDRLMQSEIRQWSTVVKAADVKVP